MAGVARSHTAGGSPAGHAEPGLLPFPGKHGSHCDLFAGSQAKGRLAAQHRAIGCIHPAQESISFFCLRCEGNTGRGVHLPAAAMGCRCAIRRDAALLCIKLQNAAPILHLRREGDIRQRQDICDFIICLRHSIQGQLVFPARRHGHLLASAGTDGADLLTKDPAEAFNRPIEAQHGIAVILIRNRQGIVFGF